MIFGDKQVFAIECHHDGPDDDSFVFGRMCLWLGGRSVGDVEEPACALNVTEHLLTAALARVGSLHDTAIDRLEPRAAFDCLDRALYVDALYLDGERPLDELEPLSRRFSKFDFLTNGGESFDSTKSFMVEVDGRSFKAAREARYLLVMRSICGCPSALVR
jgi:hypothetical protein